MSKVADRSSVVAKMVHDAAMGTALMGGTKAMREAKQTYLPQFPKEEDDAYKARLKSSWLFNGFRKTVRDMTGRVFDSPVEMGQGAPDQLVTWATNIDLQGRDLSEFARDVFVEGMKGSGISYVMVDAPARRGDESRQEAETQNLRPYFVHLKLESILGWKTRVEANVTKLAQIRIMESVSESNPDDEFDEMHIDQVRVLDYNEDRKAVDVRIYRKDSKKENWVLHDEYPTDLPEITVVPFYANRTGFFTGEPVLDDLADVNVAHWQSQSDQRNILHVARVPILFGKGFGEKESITIGSSVATMAADTEASLEWVEHKGAAIASGRQDLKDLEFQMETHGLQLLVQKGNQSATGEALDAKKETSQLAMMADALKDCLEQAFAYMADIANIAAESVEVNVNKDFGVSMMTAQEVTAMLSAVNTGNLSRETFLSELKRRGFVRDDLDVEAEIDAIDAEGGGLGAE